mgnify:FL=1
MANIGVLGAGSWGTALSVLLHDNGNQATIWSIDPAEIEMLSKEREHKTKLPGGAHLRGNSDYRRDTRGNPGKRLLCLGSSVSVYKSDCEKR